MYRKASFVVAGMVAGLGLVSFASAARPAQRVIYHGGHNPSQLYRIVPATPKPYALTGERATDGQRREVRHQPIFVGSRFVGIRQISE